MSEKDTQTQPVGPAGHAEPQAHAKIRRTTLGLVFLTIFLDLVGFGMFIPILANVARALDATTAQAASLSTWFSAGTLLAVIVLGRLSDSWGRRKLLIGTILVSTVSQLATGFAHLSPAPLLLLMAVRFVAGMAAGNISVAQAAVADITKPAERGRSMVIIGLAFGGGFAIGPALGALLARLFTDNMLPAIGVAAALLNLINLILVLTRLPETHHSFASPKLAALIAEVRASQQESAEAGADSPRRGWWPELSALLAGGPFRVVLLLQLLQVFGFVGVETMLPIVLKDAYALDDKRIFDFFMLLGIAVLVVNGGLARTALKRVGEVRTLNVGQLLLGLGICAIPALAPSAPGLAVALCILACGTGLSNPALSALVSRLSPPDRQGFAFGASQTLAALARIVGPLTMGYLYDSFHGAPSLYLSAGLMGVGWLLGVVGLVETRRRFAKGAAWNPSSQ